MSDSVPIIGTAHVHFIRPYILPDFIENLEKLKEPFKFLGSIDSYRNYYAKFEKRKSALGARPRFVPEMGELLPLPRRHTFDSFWKTFRIKARKRPESYFLMPLVISLQEIAEEKTMNYNSYAYLFPWGTICVNQEITNSGPPFFFEEMIKRNILERNRFAEWATLAARRIKECLFDQSELDVEPFSTHSLIFLDDTNPSFVLGDIHHARAIAGLIEGKIDTKNYTKEQVFDNILSCKLPPLHDGEILIFNPRATFLCPLKRGQQSKKTSSKCMRNNFSSFINFVFAVNRFLDTGESGQRQMSEERRGEIKKAFQAGFRYSNSEFELEYFTNIYHLIAKKIGLSERLTKFMGQNNVRG